jgi:hypothetical protein
VFTAEFKKIIEDNDFPPDLVFNMDEKGIGKSYHQELIPQGKKNRRLASRHPRTDLTLLLGENTSGTLKLQPLQVYHSEIFRVMKRHPKI